jgi:hypothetical protein
MARQTIADPAQCVLYCGIAKSLTASGFRLQSI